MKSIFLAVAIALVVMLLASLGAQVMLPPAAAPSVAALAASPQTLITLTADADATIRLGCPDSNYGATTYVRVDWTTSGRTIVRALVHFDLSSLGPGAVIDEAVLQLALGTATGTSPINVNAWLAGEEWFESTVT